MPSEPGRLSRFWMELRRRNVLRSLAVYAGSAFVILEAATIIFPRWGLPDWTIDMLLYVLLGGAVVNLLIAWTYDFTAEGIRKTGPSLAEGEMEAPPASNAWKVATYISLFVIILLIVLNVMQQKRGSRARDIDSLVILPFNNYTGDDELDNLVSGMHSMLIGNVGQIGRLRVISPTTSKTYEEGGRSLPDIAKEQDVKAVMEMDVYCLGDSVCFQARVISIYPKEELLWVADYKEEKSQTLKLYDRITLQITDELNIGLLPAEEEKLSHSGSVNPEAMDAYLKGIYLWERLEQNTIQEALASFQLATELDPDWADPYAGLAQAWGLFTYFGILPRSVSQPMVEKYISKALELNPHSARAHWARGVEAVYTYWDWELGEEEYRQSIESNPSDAMSRMWYAHLLMILRRTDEAVEQANIGLALDPMKPLVLGLHGVVMSDAGKYLTAINSLEKALTINPDFDYATSALLRPYFMSGDFEKWIQTWMNKVRWSDGAKALVAKAFDEGGYTAAIREMFRLNGIHAPDDCNMDDGIKAGRYLSINEYERVLDHYENLYESGSGNAAMFATNICGYDKLKDHPRYLALLEKLNLPLPD